MHISSTLLLLLLLHLVVVRERQADPEETAVEIRVRGKAEHNRLYSLGERRAVVLNAVQDAREGLLGVSAVCALLSPGVYALAMGES